MSELELKKGKQDYLEAMKDSQFASLTQEQQAEQLGIARQTIARWNKEFPWAEIFRGQLENAGRRCGKILEALIKKAEKGNLGAIGMLFEVLGVLKNTLTVKVEERAHFDSMMVEEIRAYELRVLLENPVYPGLHPEQITSAMKYMKLEEIAALRKGVLEFDAITVPAQTESSLTGDGKNA